MYWAIATGVTLPQVTRPATQPRRSARLTPHPSRRSTEHGLRCCLCCRAEHRRSPAESIAGRSEVSCICADVDGSQAASRLPVKVIRHTDIRPVSFDNRRVIGSIWRSGGVPPGVRSCGLPSKLFASCPTALFQVAKSGTSKALKNPKTAPVSIREVRRCC